MDFARHRVAPSLIAAALLAAAGCGDGKPSVDTSTTEAKVSGKVTIRGKPMKGGDITFDPANVTRKAVPPKTAKVNADGSYEVTTLVGHNAITVSGPDIVKEPALGYANETIEVVAGTNTKNIELPPPGAPTSK